MTATLGYYLLGAIVPLGLLLWAALRRRPFDLKDSLILWIPLLIWGCGLPTPAVLAGAIGLPAVSVVRRRWERTATRARLASAAALVLAVPSAADFASLRWVRYPQFLETYNAARSAYPAVPRETLLPHPAPNPLAQVQPHPGWRHLYDVTEDYPKDPRIADARRHSRNLSGFLRLNASWTDYFIRERNFAVVVRRPSWRLIPLLPHELPAIPRLAQPTATDTPLATAEAAATDTERTEPEIAEALESWHTARADDFAYPAGYGVIAGATEEAIEAGESRLITATSTVPDGARPEDGPFLVGFRSHAVRSPPGEPLAPAWRLTRIDLIGLATQEEPVAYASPDLPRTGSSSRAVERPLTTFEIQALPRLAAGEWVVSAGDGARLRAVGALPAAAACAECHGVETGRLLGALSYEFVRDSGQSGDAAAIIRDGDTGRE